MFFDTAASKRAPNLTQKCNKANFQQMDKVLKPILQCGCASAVTMEWQNKWIKIKKTFPGWWTLTTRSPWTWSGRLPPRRLGSWRRTGFAMDGSTNTNWRTFWSPTQTSTTRRSADWRRASSTSSGWREWTWWGPARRASSTTSLLKVRHNECSFVIEITSWARCLQKISRQHADLFKPIKLKQVFPEKK